MTPIGEHQYWDGGLLSNTPLGPAIKALEEATAATAPWSANSSSSSCSMRAALPQTFTDVLQRMLQLQYTSRIG